MFDARESNRRNINYFTMMMMMMMIESYVENCGFEQKSVFSVYIACVITEYRYHDTRR